MRIGIDIDGVLANTVRWQLDYGSKYYYEKYGKQIVNHKGYSTTEMFDVERKDDIEFWATHYNEYIKNSTAHRFAGEVIKKLMDAGNEIYIITAKGFFLVKNSLEDTIMTKDECHNAVIDWLKQNNIPYDKIIFTPNSKLDTCIENNIDLMIEDWSKNINEISKRIPVICFHSEYNEETSGENITRCYSWYDIYAKIMDMTTKQ